MNFKKIQDGRTFKINFYSIDGKEVTEAQFESKLDYQKYNSSLLVKDKKTGNYIHTHSQN